MFHAHDHVFGLAGDVFEDVLVVHFSGEGFLAAGVVALLEVGDLRPSGVDIGDDIAFGDLLVIHIEEDFAGGRIDGLTDLKRLGDFGEEHPGVVTGVEGFENHDEILWFKDFGHGFEAVDDVGGLVIPGESEVVGAGDDGHPGDADALGDLDGGFGFFAEVGAVFITAEGVDGF